MSAVEAPYELLDLANGESAEFSIQRFERGEVRIETRLEPEGKVVKVLRVHVSGQDKPLGAPYWDITSLTLIARLDPVLGQLVASRRRIRITKFGVAPTARHQVDFL